MAMWKKRKSKKERAGEMLVSYLTLKTAGKAAKGAKKKAEKGTAVATKKTPVAKRIPLFLGAAVAAVFAAKAIHGHRGDPAAA